MEVASLFLGKVTVLLKKRRCLSGRRDYPNPVRKIPLRIVELEHGILDLPHPLVGQYRQVAGRPNDLALVTTLGRTPAGAFEAPLYLFSGRGLPPFLSMLLMLRPRSR